MVDPKSFTWHDDDWKGLRLEGQVLYELHLGTFTREGTWNAAAECLPRLVELGITAVEVMPVAEFSGNFGWGYDGVDLFAPYHLYGQPDDMRRFVDKAHAWGSASSSTWFTITSVLMAVIIMCFPVITCIRNVAAMTGETR